MELSLLHYIYLYLRLGVVFQYRKLVFVVACFNFPIRQFSQPLYFVLLKNGCKKFMLIKT